LAARIPAGSGPNDRRLAAPDTKGYEAALTWEELHELDLLMPRGYAFVLTKSEFREFFPCEDLPAKVVILGRDVDFLDDLDFPLAPKREVY